MVRWLAVYELEKATPFGENALIGLDETLRHAREKLSVEASRKDDPASYERATSECIRRMEDIRENLAPLVASGGQGERNGGNVVGIPGDAAGGAFQVFRVNRLRDNERFLFSKNEVRVQEIPAGEPQMGEAALRDRSIRPAPPRSCHSP